MVRISLFGFTTYCIGAVIKTMILGRKRNRDQWERTETHKNRPSTDL